MKSEQKQKFHRLKANRKSSALATLDAKLPFFNALLDEYSGAEWISSDPAQFMHRYSDPRDQELAAFLSACFAYGSAKLVIRAVDKLLAPPAPTGPLSPMSASPYAFIAAFDPARDTAATRGFYHRFHKEKHLVALLEILRDVLREHGTLGGFFKSFEARDSEALLNASMREFQRRAALKPAEIQRGMRFLFNAPEDGSACKRMAMFLKWMVRKDEIDIGIWSGWFSAADLVIPVDTHIGRLSYYLRLRGGKLDAAANWKMAREITHSLKQLNPTDPVCYDFAITRLGILGLCKKKYYKSVCSKCPVEPACRFSPSERPQP